MSWSRIAIYYGVAAALAAYLFGVHWMRAPEGTAASDQSAPLVHASVSDISRVDLLRKRQRLRFERRDGRWQAVEPSSLSVTSDLIEALLETLVTVPPIEVVSLGTADPKPFGLAPPQTVIVLGESPAPAKHGAMPESGSHSAGPGGVEGAAGEASEGNGGGVKGQEAVVGGQNARGSGEAPIVERVELGARSPTQTAVYARKGGDAAIYLLGLNTSYYVDLIYQELDKQGSAREPSTGAR